MSCLLTHFWPGGTEAQYRVTVAAATKAAGGTIPETSHAAGPTELRRLYDDALAGRVERRSSLDA